MKNLLFFGIAIALLGVQAAPGFSVSSITVNPSGDLEDGAPVAVTCEIPRTGILLYDQLVITTDLDSPVWDSVVIVRNEETPVTPASAHGNTLTLNGAAYNYPLPVPVKVRVEMKGTVPHNHTMSQRLLSIRQLDADGVEYAYPSGYLLPMPGAPPLTLPLTVTIPATPENTPVQKDTAAETLSPFPAGSLPIATVPAPGTLVSLPPLLPGRTPASASPAEVLVVTGAAGIAVCCRRPKPGR